MKLSSARVAATGEVVMAYILLALGALMSLVGLAAMVTGYPMIEIERGWAMVITGSVLLSGGLVVVALGLVVRNLVGLRGALSVVGAPPASVEAVQQPFVVAPSLPAVAMVQPTFEMPPPQLATDAHPGFGVAVPAAAAALAAGAMLGRDTHLPEPPQLPEQLVEPHDTEPHPAEAHAPEALVPEAYVPEVHTPDAAREHETITAPDHQKSHEDWLDQAFSAFDHEAANGHPPTLETGAALPEPAPAFMPGPAHEPARHEAEEAEYAAETNVPNADEPPTVAHDIEPIAEPHEPLAPHAEAPATAPTEPAANLAVIGRYDSEGTSYVMYSDGSIEAQSEAGIYRFSSMAELKAFIET